MDEYSTRLNSLIYEIKTMLEVLSDVFFVPVVNINYFIDKFLQKNKLLLWLLVTRIWTLKNTSHQAFVTNEYYPKS